MAVKDHSLDQKIIDSAEKEFLAHGYQKASINTIAKNAGVTTGAIYTRYKNKDALFCALIEDLLHEIAHRAEPIGSMYYSVKSKEDIQLFLSAIEAELDVYLDLIFTHYNQCVLLFCKSAGSSMEQLLKDGIEQKVESTVAFLGNLSHKDMSGAGLIIKEQASLLPLLLESGYDRDKTISCIKLFSQYNRAGWKEIFEKNM